MALRPDQIEALRGLQEAGIITAEEFARRVGQASAPAPGGREAVFTSDAFSPGMRAATMHVPEGWKARTQVMMAPPAPGRVASCIPAMNFFLFEAAGPDGSSMRTLPGDGWLWSDHPQMRQVMEQAAQNPRFLNSCRLQPVPDAADYLKSQVLQRISGSWLQELRVVGEEKAPSLLKRFQRTVEERRGKGLPMPDQSKMRVSTARLRLTGTRDGRPMEASAETSILMLWDVPPGAPAPLMTVLVGEVALKMARAGTVQTADVAMEIMLDSLRIEDAWTQAVERFGQQLQQRQAMINAQQAQMDQQMAMQNQQMSANTQAEISRIQHETAMDNIRSIGERGRIQHNAQQQMYAQHNASVAANHARVYAVNQQFAYGLNGQQSMYNPAAGGSMVVSNQYNHTFGDQWGNVVYTDSHSLDPNASLNGNWDELKPIRY